MAYEIHKASVRQALKPRREPYFGAPIEEGRYLGYRKISEEAGTWIARCRDEDGKQHYRSLGYESAANDWRKAKAAAEEWFRSRDAGVSDDVPTVAQACREYVEDLRAEGRDKTADDAEARFRRLVYETPFGRLPMKPGKLTTAKIKAWRNAAGKSRSSQNRNLTALRAALNLAVRHKRVSPTVQSEWKAVQPHKKADRRRTIYLDASERRALLAACEGPLRDLVEAAILTGARPGELAAMKVADFDPRTATATFTGKTGTRDVPISPAAVELFNRTAKDKLPTAPLLTSPEGGHWRTPQWVSRMKEAVARAKLPSGVVLYTCRHSWITAALQSGMSTLDVARLAGTSLQMIEANYGHLVVDAARARLAGVVML